jgi:cell volume regulation protein A
LSEVADFGLIVLVVGAGLSFALGGTKLTELFPVPAPAVFLVAAAVASDLWPGLTLGTRSVVRIVVVALVVILFDGGMKVGARRFRASSVPIVSLGVLGTFATAGLIMVVAHGLFGFAWTTAGILGAAVSPTDPAVMFSVLGRREVGGRTGTILEGESGANDPVGIALMIGMIEFATRAHASFAIVIREFALEMAVGAAIGVTGGMLLLRLMRGVSLPSEALYPVRTLAAATVIYGVASVAHGSGFLAVFIAGLLIGDARAPFKAEIERFHTSLASLAEIIAFAALGLTIHLRELSLHDIWLDGLLLAVILAFAVRPLVVWMLLVPVKMRGGERLFVMWSGLKGAVPILLAAFALLGGVDAALRIYGIVFVVVLFSVLLQGTSVPLIAPRLGIPMHVRQPRGSTRFTVAPESRAFGHTVEELPLGKFSWIDRIERGGAPISAGRETRLTAGDQLVVFTEAGEVDTLRRLFEQAG